MPEKLPMASPASADAEPCTVCGGALRDHCRLRRNDLMARRCEECGAVFVINSPINAENISEFYSMAAYHGERVLDDTNLYSGYYDNCFLGYDPRDLSVQQFRGIVEKIKQLIGGANATPALLDVGCATGVFLDLARNAGFAVKGIEVSPELAEYARQNFKLEVRDNLFSAGFPARSFDAITLNDVIEHLPRPILQPMAGEIARLLKPGGILEIRTPGEDGLLRLVAKIIYFASFKTVETPMHLFYSFEHLINFTPRALVLLFESHGLPLTAHHREEENPLRLNVGFIGRIVLRISYLVSALLNREHKIVLFFKKPYEPA
jgi:SAM-dependent methyltransferase